jgi:protein-L-isoaspartate O-methyltransferase
LNKKNPHPSADLKSLTRLMEIVPEPREQGKPSLNAPMTRASPCTREIEIADIGLAARSGYQVAIIARLASPDDLCGEQHLLGASISESMAECQRR